MALFKFTKALIVVDTVKAKLPGAVIDVKSVLDADAVRAGDGRFGGYSAPYGGRKLKFARSTDSRRSALPR